MTPRDQPGHELELAIQAYNAMLHATVLDEVEVQWKICIHHLERVWNKLQALYKRDPQWHHWSGRIAKDRRTDPLLIYLINARGADEHTVGYISGRHAASFRINLEPNKSILIEELIIKDGSVQYRGLGELEVEFVPEYIVPIPVINRGRTYHPPAKHLGQELHNPCVRDLAHYGTKYYLVITAEAEVFFPPN